MRLNIIEQQRLWWAISLGAIIISVIAMGISWQQLGYPIRPGLDFVGGTRLQMSLECAATDACTDPIDVSAVRSAIAPLGLENSAIQVVEDYTLSIRSNTLTVGDRTAVLDRLTEALGAFDPTTLQVDTVGPTVGEELLTAGVQALLASFFGIIVYLSFRFRFDYAVFAIVALVHDVLITAGTFAILGFAIGNEIDSLFLVALLTIIGFSVNDTVVIYDRIREIDEISESGTSIDVIVDEAVNQTLTRSINTSLTTILPLVAIFLFGGQTLQSFALALIVGFTAGVYSSIFIASTLLAWWRKRQEIPYDTLPAPLSDKT